MRKRCYFAYTWKDSKLQIILKYLKERIENISDGEIEVIFDLESFKVSDNFKLKEQLILKSDCIVIFFSPNYKKLVEGIIDDQHGANREYQYILRAKKEKNISIIPILIKGRKEDAITEEFSNNIASIFNIDTMFEGKRGKSIKKQEKNHLETLVRKTVKETTLASRHRDYEFGTKDEMVETLFGKAYSIQKLPQRCMYKTDAYESVISQSRKFIVGRKGSGKTTFFELLERSAPERFSNKYKILRPIKADNFNLQHLFQVIYKYDDDLTIFSLDKRLQLFWEIYIYLTAIYIVCLEDDYCMIEDDRHRVFSGISQYLREKKLNVSRLDNEECQEAIFMSSVETFDKFMNQILDYAHLESYEASLTANFKIDNVMEKYFGENNYHDLCIAISKCTKDILIALDGFNTSSENFRKSTVRLLQAKNDLAEKRLNFEIYFFRTMFVTFEKLEQRNQGIMKRVSLCIIVPQDRIDQIKQEDRDFDKYNFASLSWDAIDLLEMLVIRLEYIYDIKCNENDSIQDRFKYILKKNFTSIPDHVTINVNGKQYEMELFIYMLRNSFWRPREIINFFYELYLANKKSAKHHVTLGNDTIKDIIDTKAEENIEKEVYSEYRNVLINIKEIMEIFRNRNIILKWDEVCNLLSIQNFQTTSIRKVRYPIDKFCVLYELGFLGIKVDNSIKKQENLRNDICFSYNEGLMPLEILKKMNVQKKIEVIINPIFAKILSLNFNTNEILENYSWKYLSDNHARKSTIRRI